MDPLTELLRCLISKKVVRAFFFTPATLTAYTLTIYITVEHWEFILKVENGEVTYLKSFQCQNWELHCVIKSLFSPCLLHFTYWHIFTTLRFISKARTLNFSAEFCQGPLNNRLASLTSLDTLGSDCAAQPGHFLDCLGFWGVWYIFGK